MILLSAEQDFNVWGKLAEHGTVVILMGIAVYYFWRRDEKKEKELKKCQEYILQQSQEATIREKQISEERNGDLKDILEVVNLNTNTIKNNSDVSKELAREIRSR